VGAKVSAKYEGSFAAFRGVIAVVDGEPIKSSVTAEIDIASLTVEPAKLAGHLKTPDFFDAEKFPKAKFRDDVAHVRFSLSPVRRTQRGAID
jgi:polyisoprenoid-binding protein YceI